MWSVSSVNACVESSVTSFPFSPIDTGNLSTFMAINLILYLHDYADHQARDNPFSLNQETRHTPTKYSSQTSFGHEGRVA